MEKVSNNNIFFYGRKVEKNFILSLLDDDENQKFSILVLNYFTKSNDKFLSK